MSFAGDRRPSEFKAFQDEILENSRKVFQIITSTIALCAGIIGYCFSPGHFPICWTRPFALLSTFLIVVPAMILIESYQNSTGRIAAFIMVVFEENEEVPLPGWQTALQWSRSKRQQVANSQGSPPTMQSYSSLSKQWTTLCNIIKPVKEGGRHLHLGMRAILVGIALVSYFGSASSSIWLKLHHEMGLTHIVFLCLMAGISLWVFLWAYGEMQDGWNDKCFENRKNQRSEWVRNARSAPSTLSGTS